MLTRRYLIGIDEAGRGPLAGPVAVGLVALDREQVTDPATYFTGIRDSKKLTAKGRERWFKRLEEERDANKLFFATTLVSNKVIDKQGINAAIRYGIREGLVKINIAPDSCSVLLDGGLYAPDEYENQQTIVKGDQSEALISLASIAAKVIRDRWVLELAKKYPQYGLEKHKGYGTTAHYAALTKHGPSPVHRLSFLGKSVKL